MVNYRLTKAPPAHPLPWPSHGCPAWHRYDTPLERKSTLRDWGAMGEPLRQALAWILTLDAGRLLGLPGLPLAPDATLWGAGLCEMIPGDFLSPHLDADHHPILGLERRANAILFLDDWQADWGGRLVFRGETGEEEWAFWPARGRLLAWECAEDAYHEVEPVTCPPGHARRTLSVWWYSRPRKPLCRLRARFVRLPGTPDDGLDGLREGRASL